VFPDDELVSSQDINMMMEDEEEGGTFMSGCNSAGGRSEYGGEGGATLSMMN
jgi:hypothetical protein